MLGKGWVWSRATQDSGRGLEDVSNPVTSLELAIKLPTSNVLLPSFIQ